MQYNKTSYYCISMGNDRGGETGPADPAYARSKFCIILKKIFFCKLKLLKS